MDNAEKIPNSDGMTVRMIYTNLLELNYMGDDIQLTRENIAWLAQRFPVGE